MSDLTVDDFRNILLDLYLVQRECAELRLKLAALQEENSALRKQVDEEV